MYEFLWVMAWGWLITLALAIPVLYGPDVFFWLKRTIGKRLEKRRFGWRYEVCATCANLKWQCACPKPRRFPAIWQ